MKIGIDGFAAILSDPASRQLPSVGNRMAEFIKEIEVADRAGVDVFGIGEQPGVDHSVDVRPHPHISLSTFSYLFSDEMMHRHGLRDEQAILPQKVNRMTADRGITHSERLEHASAHSDRIRGAQALVPLSIGMEDIALFFSDQ